MQLSMQALLYVGAGHCFDYGFTLSGYTGNFIACYTFYGSPADADSVEAFAALDKGKGFNCIRSCVDNDFLLLFGEGNVAL